MKFLEEKIAIKTNSLKWTFYASYEVVSTKQYNYQLRKRNGKKKCTNISRTILGYKFCSEQQHWATLPQNITVASLFSHWKPPPKEFLIYNQVKPKYLHSQDKSDSCKSSKNDSQSLHTILMKSEQRSYPTLRIKKPEGQRESKSGNIPVIQNFCMCVACKCWALHYNYSAQLQPLEFAATPLIFISFISLYWCKNANAFFKHL